MFVAWPRGLPQMRSINMTIEQYGAVIWQKAWALCNNRPHLHIVISSNSHFFGYFFHPSIGEPRHPIIRYQKHIQSIYIFMWPRHRHNTVFYPRRCYFLCHIYAFYIALSVLLSYATSVLCALSRSTYPARVVAIKHFKCYIHAIFIVSCVCCFFFFDSTSPLTNQNLIYVHPENMMYELCVMCCAVCFGVGG